MSLCHDASDTGLRRRGNLASLLHGKRQRLRYWNGRGTDWLGRSWRGVGRGENHGILAVAWFRYFGIMGAPAFCGSREERGKKAHTDPVRRAARGPHETDCRAPRRPWVRFRSAFCLRCRYEEGIGASGGMGPGGGRDGEKILRYSGPGPPEYWVCPACALRPPLVVPLRKTVRGALCSLCSLHFVDAGSWRPAAPLQLSGFRASSQVEGLAEVKLDTFGPSSEGLCSGRVRRGSGGPAHVCLTAMRWGEVRRSPLWAPRSWTRAPPVPPPSSARAAAPAGHGPANVGSTVDSYGPPHPLTSFQSSIHRGRRGPKDPGRCPGLPSAAPFWGAPTTKVLVLMRPAAPPRKRAY